jgi:AcrR family transcriptional regulator
VPRQPDPHLEKRILDAATRLWGRGGEKSLTMRAVARASRTTTPTVYERYRDRDDLLQALRAKIRAELFATIKRTRTLHHTVERYVHFALTNSHAYEVLFDGVARPPSLYEPWPTFNLIRQRITDRLGGRPREHTRLMLSIWSLMHGAAMLMIRGDFGKSLRRQTVHACLDAIDAILDAAAAGKVARSGPKWPSDLILGEGKRSRAGSGTNGGRVKNWALATKLHRAVRRREGSQRAKRAKPERNN